MKLLMFAVVALSLSGCASVSVSKNLSVVAFDDKSTGPEPQAIGSIEGKDCTWYVLGYSVGEHPSVRNAFMNAAKQQEGSMIPGQAAKIKGTPLRAVKNVSVSQSGFNAYVASRRCVVVSGMGLQ